MIRLEGITVTVLLDHERTTIGTAEVAELLTDYLHSEMLEALEITAWNLSGGPGGDMVLYVTLDRPEDDQEPGRIGTIGVRAQSFSAATDAFVRRLSNADDRGYDSLRETYCVVGPHTKHVHSGNCHVFPELPSHQQHW